MDGHGGNKSGSTPNRRFRLPGIDRPGIIQQSMLETALWPQDPAFKGPLWEPTYQFSRSKGGPREVARVQIRSPFGLQQSDPYILWGLLGATIERGGDAELVASPYWMMNYLGMHKGGTQYKQFANALERLAMTGYANRAFYNPIEQEFQRVAFSFFSTWLPTTDMQGTVDPERTWRIQWEPQFFKLCKASNGSLLFDLEILKQLKPMTRQLFLMLQCRFWRSTRVYMNVNDLTINGMGLSASVPLKKRKQQLTQAMDELLKQNIIRLGRGKEKPADLIFRRSKGVFVATFYKGSYFEAPHAEGTVRKHQAASDDELYVPLQKIGLDEKMIRKAFKEISRGRIQQAVRITEMAMHESPEGFPGFKKSPAAFCWHFMSSDYMPPDWMHAHEKRQKRIQWDNDREQADVEEQRLRDSYDKARRAALGSFIKGDGKQHWEESYRSLLEVYRARGDRNYHRLAGDAAVARVESLHFKFPEFAAWAMTQLERN